MLLSLTPRCSAVEATVGTDHQAEAVRTYPESALVTYLTVIDRAPDVVRAALATC